MNKKYIFVALVVLGVISTSYAKQEAFIEYQEMRSEERLAQKDQAVRAPAQASDQKVLSAEERDAKELRMELWMNRTGKF